MADKKTYVFKILTFVLCAVVSLSVFWHGGMVSRAETLDGLDWYSTTSSASFVHDVVRVADTKYESNVGTTRYQNLAWVDHFSFTLYFPFSTVADQIFIYDSDAVFAGFTPALSASCLTPRDGVVLSTLLDNVSYTWSFMCNGKESAIPDISAFWVIGPEFTGGSMQMYIKCIVELDLSVMKKFNPAATGEGWLSDKISLNMSLKMDRWQHNQFTSPYTALKAQLASIDAKLADGGGSAQIINKIDQQIQQQHTDAQNQQTLTQQQTQQQHSDAQDQLSESQKQTAIQEEQKETTKGIFGKITSFFDGFGDMVAHLVVPTSDELMTFLDEVNTWFGDRLGFIYYPFDFAVQVVQAFALGDANQQFAVPGLTLNILGEQYTIWETFAVDLDAMGIFTYVRYFTSAILCLGVGKLAVDKWSDWIGGKRG